MAANAEIRGLASHIHVFVEGGGLRRYLGGSKIMLASCGVRHSDFDVAKRVGYVELYLLSATY